MKQITLNKAAFIIAVGAALVGCTAIERSNAMDTERMLSASGFNMKFADTPQKLAHLQSMTQRKVATDSTRTSICSTPGPGRSVTPYGSGKPHAAPAITGARPCAPWLSATSMTGKATNLWQSAARIRLSMK